MLSVASLTILAFFFGVLSAACFCWLNDIAQLTHPKLDGFSAILICLILINILYKVSTIFAGSVFLSMVLIVVDILLLVVFVKQQQSLAQPLIDWSPLSVKPFVLGVIINMFSLISIFAINIVTPMFLQNGLGILVLVASLTLFPANNQKIIVVIQIKNKCCDQRSQHLLNTSHIHFLISRLRQRPIQ